MDTKEEILARMKSGKKDLVYQAPLVKKESKFKSGKWVTKFFLSIIFIISSLIFVKISDENSELYKEYILTNSMSFTTFNSLYETYFGSVAPSINTDEFVFSSDLTYTAIEVLDDKEIISMSSSVVTALTGGIVVYIGEKDDFGYTVIVQGNDGNNIWYGNLENTSPTLYDYIEEGEIIGEAVDKSLYISIKNGDEIISYETYKN